MISLISESSISFSVSCDCVTCDCDLYDHSVTDVIPLSYFMTYMTIIHDIISHSLSKSKMIKMKMKLKIK